MENGAIAHPDMKEFTNMLFALRGLTTDLINEKETLLSSASQIVYANKEFRKLCEQFHEQVEETKKQIEYVVAAEMKKIAKGITEEVGNNIIDILTSKSEEAVKRLELTSNTCEKKLRAASKSISFFSRGFYVATIMTTLIGGVTGGLVVHYLFPKMDKEVISRLNRSVTFSDFSRMVDEKEKHQRKVEISSK